MMYFQIKFKFLITKFSIDNIFNAERLSFFWIGL